MDIAHIQGKMQPPSDRVHAHSKLLTFMEISMSYTCFSGTELLVHTIRGNLMPTSPHSSKQWAYSFGSWLLCPNLPNRIVVEQQKSHPVPDAPTAPGSTGAGRWCWLWNLCAIWVSELAEFLRECWINQLPTELVSSLHLQATTDSSHWT